MSEPLTSETGGGSRSPSRPSPCIESVPVRLLPQFPPLLNIGPETAAVVVAGWVCPLGLVLLCCPVLEREVGVGLQLFKAPPRIPQHPEQVDKGPFLEHLGSLFGTSACVV